MCPAKGRTCLTSSNDKSWPRRCSTASRNAGPRTTDRPHRAALRLVHTSQADHAYTVVEWAGAWHHGHGYGDELRVQVWDKEPYELYTVMIVLERHRTGACKESRGPIFRLDEACRPKWDAFLKELKEAYEAQHQAIA